MEQIKISQKNFNSLVDTLNHRVTKLETHVGWMKWILGYIAMALTYNIFG